MGLKVIGRIRQTAVILIPLIVLCVYLVYSVTYPGGDARSILNFQMDTASVDEKLCVTQGDGHKFGTELLSCVDPYAPIYKRVEDLFCLKLPPFVQQLKNPCFYIRQKSGSQLRCLPYFYILGIEKSATTDLFNRITSHPAVRKNKGTWDKEVHFWSRDRLGAGEDSGGHAVKYLNNYFSMFDETSQEIETGMINNSKNGIVTGDATPMNFWEFHYWDRIPQNFGKREPEVLTPYLIKQVYQDWVPKMLIQFREPVERLYSDYIFLKRGENPQTFHDHVVETIKIVTDCLKTRSKRLCLFDVEVHKRSRVRLHMGCYSLYFKEWLKVYPLSAFHITRMEDYKDDIRGTLKKIFSFMGLDPLPDKHLNNIVSMDHMLVTKNKKGNVLPKTFAILHEFYLPCLQEMAALLKDDRFLWEDVYKLRREEETINTG